MIIVQYKKSDESITLIGTTEDYKLDLINHPKLIESAIKNYFKDKTADEINECWLTFIGDKMFVNNVYKYGLQ